MSENTALFTVRRVMRILLYVTIIGFFCPSFLVSCAGYGNFEVSTMDLAAGIKSSGYEVTDPAPIVFLSLILPIIALVFLYIKKMSVKKVQTAAMASTLLNFLMWIWYLIEVAKAKEDNYLTVKYSGWLYINMLSIIAVLVLSVLAIAGKLQLDSDLLQAISGDSPGLNTEQVAGAVRTAGGAMAKTAGDLARSLRSKTPNENIAGYCYKCGNPISCGSNFCSVCGTPVAPVLETKPESLSSEPLSSPVSFTEKTEHPKTSAVHNEPKDTGFSSAGDL